MWEHSSRSKSSDLASAPTRRALRPSDPGGVYAGQAAPAPTSGPTRPTPGVPFVSRRKEPKACRGCAPGPPEGGTLSPLRRCRTPQIGLQTLTQTDLPLEFVGRPVFFSPGDWQRSHFLLSIRGAAGSLPPRIPRAFLSSTNTARAEGGGIQGGPPPCAGGPGTRRSLAYLCLLSLREKVGRGAGRSARSRGGAQRTGR